MRSGSVHVGRVFCFSLLLRMEDGRIILKYETCTAMTVMMIYSFIVENAFSAVVSVLMHRNLIEK